jgi:hypothetical protein
MIFKLLIAFQLKHLLADYFFQTEYMLDKQKARGWFLPLFAHVSVHGIFTLIFCLAFGRPELCWLALFDGSVHFIVDRLKAVYSRNMTTANPLYWRALGVDQALHHCTHYFIVWLMVSF